MGYVSKLVRLVLTTYGDRAIFNIANAANNE